MIDEAVAKRYADAYLAYAREKIGFERALAELQDAKRVVRDNPELQTFFAAGDIIPAEKASVIDAVFGGGYSACIRHFVKLLIKNRRIDRFVDIAEYARLAYTHGIEHDALLTTSYTVDTATLEKLKAALEKRTGKKLHLYILMDPDLLGGVTAQVGNIIIDGSVKRRLVDLREKLKLTKVV